MKNRLFCLAVVGLPLLGSLGCTKDGPQVPDDITLEFSRKALEYVQLAEGTRLVYRDSATAILDTVMVTKSSLEKIFFPAWEATFWEVPIKYPARWYDYFSIILTKTSGSQQIRWFKGEASALDEFRDTSVNNAYMKLNESYFIGPDNMEQGATCLYYSEEQIQEIFITTIVEGKTYNNVSVFVGEANVVDINDPYYRKATYYWAKGVGIIKKTIVTAGGVVKTFTLVSSD